MSYICPVCGFPALERCPHPSEGGASDEICPSCGFQFGYDDDDLGIPFEQWREEWRAKGMPWFSTGTQHPKEWNPVTQLSRLEEGRARR